MKILMRSTMNSVWFKTAKNLGVLLAVAGSLATVVVSANDKVSAGTEARVIAQETKLIAQELAKNTAETDNAEAAARLAGDNALKDSLTKLINENSIETRRVILEVMKPMQKDLRDTRDATMKVSGGVESMQAILRGK